MTIMLFLSNIYTVGSKKSFKYAPKRVAVNRAVFEEVKRVLFYTTIEEF